MEYYAMLRLQELKSFYYIILIVQAIRYTIVTNVKREASFSIKLHGFSFYLELFVYSLLFLMFLIFLTMQTLNLVRRNLLTSQMNNRN